MGNCEFEREQGGLEGKALGEEREGEIMRLYYNLKN